MGRPRNQSIEVVRFGAMHAFWEHGYTGTSLSILEEATGTGRRSILNSFGDKKALFKEILSDFRDYAGKKYISGMEQPDANLASIKRTLGTVAGVFTKSAYHRGCLICNTATEQIVRDPTIHNEVRMHFVRLEDGYFNALKNSQRDGEVSESLDLRETAQELLALHIGLCTLARTGEDGQKIRNIGLSRLRKLAR